MGCKFVLEFWLSHTNTLSVGEDVLFLPRDNCLVYMVGTVIFVFFKLLESTNPILGSREENNSERLEKDMTK